MSKVLKINLIELATRVMLGLPVEKPSKNLFDLDYVGIKASQFSFNRLQKADPVLGVDMSSTGSAKQKVDMLDAAHMLVEHGYKIRRAAIDLNVPLITNSRLASAFIYAFCTTKLEDIDIKAWGEY